MRANEQGVARAQHRDKPRGERKLGPHVPKLKGRTRLVFLREARQEKAEKTCDGQTGAAAFHVFVGGDDVGDSSLGDSEL